MKSPEDEGPSESHGAEERLRQHLQARLPADEVDEVLRNLQLEPELHEVPGEESPTSDDPAKAERDGAQADGATSAANRETD